MNQSKSTETYKITLKIVLLAVFTLLVIAAVMLTIVLQFHVSTNDDSGDVRNWISLVMEVALAGFIGIAILIYSNNEQKRTSNLVQNMNEVTTKLDKIIEQQYTREKQWKNEWVQRIISDLNQIKQLHKILETWLVDYINNKSEHAKKNIINSAERLGSIVNFHIQNLNENIPKIENLLNDPILATRIAKQSEYYLISFQILDKEHFWSDEGLNGQILALEDKIRVITDSISGIEKEIIRET